MTTLAAPHQSALNHPDMVRCNPKLGRNIHLSHSSFERADARDVCLGEFRGGVGFSARVALLCYAVGDVVGNRSEKEVVDIYARRLVACVADDKPIGNCTVSPEPRGARCAHRLGIYAIPSVALLVKRKLPDMTRRLVPSVLGYPSRLDPLAVSNGKADGLTLYQAPLPRGARREWGELAAATETAPPRVRRGTVDDPSVVTAQEPDRMTSNPTSALIGALRDGRWLAAAALAKAGRVRWLLVTLGLTQGSTPWVMAPGAHTSRGRFTPTHSTGAVG